MVRKRYSEEFRAEAVRMMIMDGLTAGEVSEKLGVKAGMLYKWRQEHVQQIGLGKKSNELSAVEMADEINRLRKQLARQERITEILKKTVVYFAKDEQGGMNS